MRLRCLCVDLSACPPGPGKSGVSAPSGCDLIGALASQHRECTVHRFLPEPRNKSSALEEVRWSCREIGLMCSVGSIPIDDTHVAAEVDTAGPCWGQSRSQRRELGNSSSSTGWDLHGHLVRVGVEGTGSYGAGLTRYLSRRPTSLVVEANRPSSPATLPACLQVGSASTPRQQLGRPPRAIATSVPKSGEGPVARACVSLRTARRSAVKARTLAANQIHSSGDYRP